MYVLRQQEAESILAPYLESIGLTMMRAWDRFWLNEERVALSDPIVRGNVVSALIRDEARRLLASTPFREVPNYGEHVLWVWDGMIAVRFKKVGPQGLSRNLATQRALDFNRNLDLPGIPSRTPRVDAGYKLNRIETAIAEMLIVFRDGDQVAWDIPIPMPDERAAVPIRQPEPVQASDRFDARVRPKTPDVKEGLGDPGKDG